MLQLLAMAARPEEIAQVDDFLAQPKLLSGFPPEFGPRARGAGAPMWSADWPISDANGIVGGGSLRTNFSPASRKPFSLSLLYRERCITRLDMVDIGECHSNPLFARALMLPPIVCGPHLHRWGHNRQHVLLSGQWELPCREPLQTQIRRFEQALAWLADQVNLALGPDGREFDLPRELL